MDKNYHGGPPSARCSICSGSYHTNQNCPSQYRIPSNECIVSLEQVIQGSTKDPQGYTAINAFEGVTALRQLLETYLTLSLHQGIDHEDSKSTLSLIERLSYGRVYPQRVQIQDICKMFLTDSNKEIAALKNHIKYDELLASYALRPGGIVLIGSGIGLIMVGTPLMSTIGSILALGGTAFSALGHLMNHTGYVGGSQVSYENVHKLFEKYNDALRVETQNGLGASIDHGCFDMIRLREVWGLISLHFLRTYRQGSEQKSLVVR